MNPSRQTSGGGRTDGGRRPTPRRPAAGPMPEREYRASRWCRTLGNPTAYRLVRALAAGPRTPSELSTELRRHLTCVSMTLRHLRELDLVRYRRQGKRTLYELKAPGLPALLDAIERTASAWTAARESPNRD